MTDQTVPSGEQPDHFAQIAAELRSIAIDIHNELVGSGLPMPRIQLNIQPGIRGDDEKIVKAIDALAMTLLGHPGRVEKMGGGVYHYSTDHEKRGPLEIAVYGAVSTPWGEQHHLASQLAAREAELEKLQAEKAELQEALDQIHAGALDEDNQRAKAEVIANLRSGELGRITNPNLARFLAHREDARRVAEVAAR